MTLLFALLIAIASAQSFTTPWGQSEPISVTVSRQGDDARKAALGGSGKVDLFTARACNLGEVERRYSAGLMLARVEQFGIDVIPDGLVPAVSEMATRRTGWGRAAYVLGWLAAGAGIAGAAGVFGGDTEKTKLLIGIGSTALKMAADEAAKRKQPVGGIRTLQWLDPNEPPFTLHPGACYARAVLGSREVVDDRHR